MPVRRSGLAAAACGFIAIVLGCGGIAGPVEELLVGDIGLAWYDARDEMSLVAVVGEGEGKRVGETLVRGTVFAVGWNESHVIAKRHPRAEPSGSPDWSRTEYYIVSVRGKRVHRPFGRADFVLHCDLLGVAEDLDFTLTFPELK